MLAPKNAKKADRYAYQGKKQDGRVPEKLAVMTKAKTTSADKDIVR